MIVCLQQTTNMNDKKENMMDTATGMNTHPVENFHADDTNGENVEKFHVHPMLFICQNRCNSIALK